MGRFIIEGAFSFDVIADDKEDAYDVLFDALARDRDMGDAVCQTAEVREVPYKALPASGAERWAEAATDIRFSEEILDQNRDRMWGMYDGSWWWTNGHVMLRCEGAPPPDAPSQPERWRRIPDEDFAKAVAKDRPREATAWSNEIDRSRFTTPGRRAEAYPDVGVQAKYYNLIEDSIPDTRWEIGPVVETPIHVRDVEGRLLAVVMPMRPGDWPAINHARVKSAQPSSAAPATPTGSKEK